MSMDKKIGAHEDGHTVGPILFESDRIRTRVEQLALKINTDYQGCESLMVIGIQKGSAFLTADLVRSITVPLILSYVTVSSYGLNALQSDGPKIEQHSDLPVSGFHVLLIEDIIDTGRTLSLLRQSLLDQGALSVHIVVLLDLKSRSASREITPCYCGFESLAQWVCGYGIDYKERYRNFPNIHTIESPSP